MNNFPATVRRARAELLEFEERLYHRVHGGFVENIISKLRAPVYNVASVLEYLNQRAEGVDVPDTMRKIYKTHIAFLELLSIYPARRMDIELTSWEQGTLKQAHTYASNGSKSCLYIDHPTTNRLVLLIYSEIDRAHDPWVGEIVKPITYEIFASSAMSFKKFGLVAPLAAVYLTLDEASKILEVDLEKRCAELLRKVILLPFADDPTIREYVLNSIQHYRPQPTSKKHWPKFHETLMLRRFMINAGGLRRMNMREEDKTAADIRAGHLLLETRRLYIQPNILVSSAQVFGQWQIFQGALIFWDGERPADDEKVKFIAAAPKDSDQHATYFPTMTDASRGFSFLDQNLQPVYIKDVR